MIAMVLAGLLAGLVNALAGGGPILTLMALTLLGVDARIANLTSSVALVPGQLITGWAGWRMGQASVRPVLIVGAALGGIAGAILLVLIPSRAFGQLVPWLVLFATLAYLATPGARSDVDAPDATASLPRWVGWIVPLLGIYGGFYGGGNSFMLLAVLGWAAMASKRANDTKNTLVAVINAAAAVVFVGSGTVAWEYAWPLAAGNIAGSMLGLKLLGRLSGKWLRVVVIVAGFALATVLFWQYYLR